MDSSWKIENILDLESTLELEFWLWEKKQDPLLEKLSELLQKIENKFSTDISNISKEMTNIIKSTKEELGSEIKSFQKGLTEVSKIKEDMTVLKNMS